MMIHDCHDIKLKQFSKVCENDIITGIAMKDYLFLVGGGGGGTWDCVIPHPTPTNNR